MKKLIFLIVVCGSFSASGQTRKFMAEARNILKSVDTTFAIEDNSGTSDEYDFVAQGMEELELIFLSELKRTSRNRPDVLSVSQTLNNLAKVATVCWKGSQYSDLDKWKKLDKYFKRATYGTTSKFNIIKEVSFRIKLVKARGSQYYYDAKGSAGGLNLYSGKKPKNNKEREEMDQVPLTCYSSAELIEFFIAQVKRKRLYNDLKRGNLSFVGLSLVVDQNTIHRSKIPTARVVLIFGARRMKNVPVLSTKTD